MIRLKKFKNMQGYSIALNLVQGLKSRAHKSDIQSYMAAAELLGIVNKQTAQAIIELGTQRGYDAIMQEHNNEHSRRQHLENTKPEYQQEALKDENQVWSEVM